VIEARTVWPLVMTDTAGRAYSVRVADLPGGRGDGAPLTTMIELQDGAKLAQALCDAPEAQYLFANSGGYGFIAQVADLVSRQRAGKAFMTLAKGEKPLLPAKVGPAARWQRSRRPPGCWSSAGRAQSHVQGPRPHRAGDRPKDEMVAVAVGDGTSFTVGGAGRGGKATEFKVGARDMATYRGARARKGQPLPAKIKPTALG